MPNAYNIMLRNIVHIHIPAFPIEVARVVEPRLRGRPVAIAPPQSQRSLIVCVSTEARREGIFKGMAVVQAKALCPHLEILPPNPQLTEKAFRSLMWLAAHYTPLWEPSRPGHIYLDLTGTQRLWGRAKDTAWRLSKDIRARLELRGVAGVATNKMVSSIASRILFPRGVSGAEAGEIVDVEQGREEAFMAPLKVSMVPGIGRFHLRVLLEDLNIIRVGQLASLAMEDMHLIFGSKAPIIHQRAHGIDPTPVYPAPSKPIISEQIIFAEDENDNEKLLASLYSLVERCARRLREKGAYPQRAGLMIRYSDTIEATRRLRIPTLTYWDFELFPYMKKLFFSACNRRVRVRFMRIWFCDLFYEDRQLCLFDQTCAEREKGKAIVKALDKIRARYGDKAIRYAKAA